MTLEATRALVQSAATGDRAAVEALLQKYLPSLRAFLRLRAGAEIRAKESTSDLAQSVCRELFEGVGDFRFEGEAAFRAWLFTAALRKVADRAQHYRAQKREAARELSPEARHAGGDALVWDCYQTVSTPSAYAIAREQATRIERAFDALSEEQREVVTLARIAGLSRAEIGERIGKSEGAVRLILHRALAQIADELGDG
jgi:RNA polymerase sigma-70 factor (ECF subfamily)